MIFSGIGTSRLEQACTGQSALGSTNNGCPMSRF